MKRFKKPPLIHELELEQPMDVYDADKVYAEMSRIGLGSKWSDWYHGQTGVISKTGRFCIFKYDVDRFLDEKPVID